MVYGHNIRGKHQSTLDRFAYTDGFCLSVLAVSLAPRVFVRMVLERLQLGCVYLGNAGVPAPDEIGVELEDDGEYRAAEALWEKARIVFLGSAQSECAPSWKSAGFSVIEEGERWWLEVESALKGQMS